MCLAMFLDAARYENTRGRSLGSEAIAIWLPIDFQEFYVFCLFRLKFVQTKKDFYRKSRQNWHRWCSNETDKSLILPIFFTFITSISFLHQIH